jgi:hypothetical protein
MGKKNRLDVISAAKIMGITGYGTVKRKDALALKLQLL